VGISVLNLAADSSKIDGLSSAMVVAWICCMHWTLYTCAHMIKCTTYGEGQGEGVGV